MKTLNFNMFDYFLKGKSSKSKLSHQVTPNDKNVQSDEEIGEVKLLKYKETGSLNNKILHCALNGDQNFKESNGNSSKCLRDQEKPKDRPARPLKVRNLLNNQEAMDTLHAKAPDVSIRCLMAV